MEVRAGGTDVDYSYALFDGVADAAAGVGAGHVGRSGVASELSKDNSGFVDVEEVSRRMGDCM